MSAKTKTESNLGELALAVLFLSVLALLTANILVFEVAAKHNDDVCRSITIAAAKAAVDGKDASSVKNIAMQEITRAGYGGFFIAPPRLMRFTDAVQDNKRRIVVQTQTMAKVPVPNLIVTDNKLAALTLKRTYVAEIGVAPGQPEPKKSDEK